MSPTTGIPQTFYINPPSIVLLAHTTMMVDTQHFVMVHNKKIAHRSCVSQHPLAIVAMLSRHLWWRRRGKHLWWQRRRCPAD
jgi:hypothetical protein